MDPIDARELFAASRHCTYMNHAAVAPLPRPVITAMTRYLEQCGSLGSGAGPDDGHIEGIRQAAARFLGADRDEIAFTHSISHGLNIVAAGLDWHPGDNLICAETEFVANVYPWTNLRPRGVEVRFTPARQNRILVEDVAALIDKRTRLIAISFVEFGTGYRNNLDALASLCHDWGLYLCVDGIQGLGALEFSVTDTPVDFVAAHAAKWMLGPIGAGFLYIRRELLERLAPIMVGWRSVVHRDDYYRYDSPLRNSGERFEPGSHNVVGLLGMEAAIELLLSVGLARIEERILLLIDLLIAGLEKRGYTITSPIAHRKERSGILCFRHHSVDTATILRHLEAAGIVVSLRGDVIRVSPHFYNTEDDVERLLDGLPT
jgi:selenocysteine lyase/cysteine desulfurase